MLQFLISPSWLRARIPSFVSCPVLSCPPRTLQSTATRVSPSDNHTDGRMRVLSCPLLSSPVLSCPLLSSPLLSVPLRSALLCSALLSPLQLSASSSTFPSVFVSPLPVPPNLFLPLLFFSARPCYDLVESSRRGSPSESRPRLFF